MQIKDLPASTTLASTDMLAKDNASGTTQKITVGDVVSSIAANNLTTTSAGKVLDARQAVELKVLKCTWNSVTSFTNPFTNSGITSDMYVIHSELSNPSAQLSDWTVQTSTGSLSISGTISGQTNITLYLAHGR